MKRFLAFVVLAFFVSSSSTGTAALVSYNLAGQPGTQVSNAPAFVAANLIGSDLTRSGAVAAAGVNSMNSNNWSVGDYYSFGFTVNPNYFADLTTLEIGTSASNTGPRFFELYSSVDGFGTSLATIAHGNGSSNFGFVNSVVDLSTLTGLTGNVEFRLVVDQDLRVNADNTIATTGTARITNYFSSGDTGGFRINGTVTAVPEPSSMALLSVAGVGSLAARRFRKKRSGTDCEALGTRPSFAHRAATVYRNDWAAGEAMASRSTRRT